MQLPAYRPSPRTMLQLARRSWPYFLPGWIWPGFHLYFVLFATNPSPGAKYISYGLLAVSAVLCGVPQRRNEMDYGHTLFIGVLAPILFWAVLFVVFGRLTTSWSGLGWIK